LFPCPPKSPEGPNAYHTPPRATVIASRSRPGSVAAQECDHCAPRALQHPVLRVDGGALAPHLLDADVARSASVFAERSAIAFAPSQAALRWM